MSVTLSFPYAVLIQVANRKRNAKIAALFQFAFQKAARRSDARPAGDDGIDKARVLHRQFPEEFQHRVAHRVEIYREHKAELFALIQCVVISLAAQSIHNRDDLLTLIRQLLRCVQ